MSTNNGGPAFPIPVDGVPPIDRQGMTLRDYFAAKAMQAILAKWPSMQVTEREFIHLTAELAESAFDVAEAMLKERDRR